MADSKLAKLYAKTAETYRGVKDGEFEAWEGVLGRFRLQDVEFAVDAWMGDTELDEYTQKCRGSKMPTPADIKAIIERNLRSSTPHFAACYKNGCEGGWIRKFSGKTIGADSEGHGPNKVDEKVGAVTRCQCFLDWAAAQPKPTVKLQRGKSKLLHM